MDSLRKKKQHLRWLTIDEVGMIPDELLGAFERHLTDASVESRFSVRADKSIRSFGGYNLLTFGDLFQIPPIPSSASVCIPHYENASEGKAEVQVDAPLYKKKSEHAKKAIELFWGQDADALNYFVELTIQKRIADSWYNEVLRECRFGRMTSESYNFLH